MAVSYCHGIFFAVTCVGGDSDDSRERQIFSSVRRVCDKDVVEKLDNFTIKCIEGANPKSDEGPEDWITKCFYMA